MALLSVVVGYAVPDGRYERRPLRTDLVHPALVVAGAVLLVGCELAFGTSLHAVAAGLFCLALVVVTATDLEYWIVPNRIVLPASVIVLIAMTAAEPSPEWAIAALAAGTGLLVAALVYPAGLGMGDVKLAVLMGAALGRAVPVAIVVALVASLVLTLFVFVRHGRAARKMSFPFAPFLALGSVVALFAGDVLLDAYLHGA